MYSSLDLVIPCFARARDPVCTWRSFFVLESGSAASAASLASPVESEDKAMLQAEFDRELEWAGARRKCDGAGAGKTAAEIKQLGGCKSVMISSERRRVEGCDELFPGCCCMANQDPAEGRQITTASNQHLYCIIRNPTFHFSNQHQRWLTASETLLANGFPVLRSLADPRGKLQRVTAFAVGGDASQMLARTRNAGVAQSGNSLNVPNAGAIILFALLWSRCSFELPIVHFSCN